MGQELIEHIVALGALYCLIGYRRLSGNV